MKFRTDFVTNSSSSSFGIQLDVRLEDGTDLSICGDEEKGDFGNSISCSFRVADPAGNNASKKACRYSYEEMGSSYFALESISFASAPVAPLLNGIADASDVNGAAAVIVEFFGLNTREAKKNREGCEQPELVEEAQKRFAAVADACGEALRARCGERPEFRNVTISVDLYNSHMIKLSEMLRTLFGEGGVRKIVEICKFYVAEYAEYIEDDILDRLHALGCLRRFTRQSLKTILHLTNDWDRFNEYLDCMEEIDMQLLPDGTIDLRFEET